MKKLIIILAIWVSYFSVAQEEKPSIDNQMISDSIIKTEIIDIVTSYAPKVSDAYKIKRKPIISFSKDINKKKLQYSISSAPVASTFVPKSGALKTIDIGERERLFNNYISLGFGNNTTPYLDIYLHENTAFESEFGVHLKGIYSKNPVKNNRLTSSYYNASADLFYKEEDRYFDWTIGIKAKRDMYNWYGLPENITYEDYVINKLDTEQVYKLYQLSGKLEFDESYIEKINTSISYFSDIYSSSELSGNLESLLGFPIGDNFIKTRLSLNFLGGNFAKSYQNREKRKHQFLIAGINPYYTFNLGTFAFTAGVKGNFAMDMVNNTNKFYVYPDVYISHPIIKKAANIYLGASGGLETNSFKKFTDQNPYIAPTTLISLTSKTYNAFGGFKGIINDNINYHIGVNYQNEVSKPLFVINPSKSDGTTTAGNGFKFDSYEYGNSFDVIYDNVQTIHFLGELQYDVTKKLSLGIQGSYSKYNLENEKYAWNLPELKAEISGTYNTKKWYASTNLYMIGKRKSFEYNGTSTNIVDLKSYIDININGGYHINSFFTIFIQGNNLSNANYQRYTNFNSQGIQVIGGVLWKFDNLF